MAFRSDTNNRDVPNTWDETVLDGEVDGYERSINFPYSQDISELETNLSELEVEISEDKRGLRDRAQILYHLEDQEEIYNLIR